MLVRRKLFGLGLLGVLLSQISSGMEADCLHYLQSFAQHAQTAATLNLVDLGPGLKAIANGKSQPDIEHPSEIEGSRAFAAQLHKQGLTLLLLPNYRGIPVPGFDGIIFNGETPVANYSHKQCSPANLAKNLARAQNHAQDFISAFAQHGTFSRADQAYLTSIFGMDHTPPRKLQIVVSLTEDYGRTTQSPEVIQFIQARIKNSAGLIESITLNQEAKLFLITSSGTKRN